MKIITFCFLIFLSCALSSVCEGQTKFQAPDTIPNYASYKYVNECLVAVRRLYSQADLKDSIWKDTASPENRLDQRPISPEAIKHGRTCLQSLNLDTVRAAKRELEILGLILLLVDRDEDFLKLSKRMLDLAANEREWSDIYNTTSQLLSSARPTRLTGLKQWMEVSRLNEPAASIQARRLGMKVQIGLAALDLGEIETAKQMVGDIFKEIQGNVVDLKSSENRYYLNEGYALAYEVMFDEGMDSLKVSTEAYKQYLRNLWDRFSDAPFEETQEVTGLISPVLVGKYWYKNDWPVDSNGQIQPGSVVTKSNPEVRPVPGKINVLVFLGGGCHPYGQGLPTQYARYSSSASCWRISAIVKRLKKEFPNLQVTVLTKTFGTFGGGKPVDPEEEAVLLSNYILGFFSMPAVQAISETEFFRLPGLDRRRVDLDVQYEEDFQNIRTSTGIILIDEKGKIFHSFIHNSLKSREELMIRKKLSAVFSRLAQN